MSILHSFSRGNPLTSKFVHPSGLLLYFRPLIILTTCSHLSLATIFTMNVYMPHWAIRIYTENRYIRTTWKAPWDHLFRSFSLSAWAHICMLILRRIFVVVVVVVVDEIDRSYIIQTPWAWHNARSSMPDTPNDTREWHGQIYINTYLFESVAIRWSFFFLLFFFQCAAFFFNLNIYI